jgi:hypothetical protein
MSKSMTKIDSIYILHFIDKVFNVESKRRDTKLKVGQLGLPSQIYTSKKSHVEEVVEEMDREKKLEIGDKFFDKIAEILNERKTSILGFIHTKIYDKVLNAREYQLMKYKHFYQMLEMNGVQVTPQEKIAIEFIVPPFLDKAMELTSLIFMISKHGNTEPFPKSNRHINYRSEFCFNIQLFPGQLFGCSTV